VRGGWSRTKTGKFEMEQSCQCCRVETMRKRWQGMVPCEMSVGKALRAEVISDRHQIKCPH
jgi:hypothetical protein